MTKTAVALAFILSCRCAVGGPWLLRFSCTPGPSMPVCVSYQVQA